MLRSRELESSLELDAVTVGVEGGDLAEPCDRDAALAGGELIRRHGLDERHESVTAAPKVVDDDVASRRHHRSRVSCVELVHDLG